MEQQASENYRPTKNPCRLCTPFGACVAFNGVAGCAPYIHGSQGCATYIRRYLIGHFREPVDIACSSFGESTTIFGGKENFDTGISNVIDGYAPKMVGICSTCLSETIGDDVSQFIYEYNKNNNTAPLPYLVNVSTPSYCGTHSDGFHKANRAIVKTLAIETMKHRGINIFPGMLSPADLRYLKEIMNDFCLPAMLLSDYSDSFDGQTWDKYEKNIEFGTEIKDIEKAGGAKASIEFSTTVDDESSAAGYLTETFDVPAHTMPMPLSVTSTDKFFELVSSLSENPIPQKHLSERGRLIDAYVDGHKYVFEKRAVIYGDEDMVIGLACFLAEIGIIPALCATGGQGGKLQESLEKLLPEMISQITVQEDTDFIDINDCARSLEPDIIIGNSNGYKLKRQLDIPLVRIGLPIHDRIGASRILHVGYRGAQQLYDRIVNAFIEIQQEDSPVGYTHI